MARIWDPAEIGLETSVVLWQTPFSANHHVHSLDDIYAERVSFNIAQECGVWLAWSLHVARPSPLLSLQEKQVDSSQT